MHSPVGKRDRWWALALLVAALGFGYLLIVHPLWTVPMLAQQARIEGLRQRDLQVRLALSGRDALQQDITQLQAALAEVPGFVAERSPELATAALVQRLEQAVAQVSPDHRSCAISHRAPMSMDNRSRRFEQVGVQVRLRCGVQEAAALLHLLESGTPRLFIENLNMLAQQFQASPGEQGLGLDVAFDLIGFLSPAPPAPPVPAQGAGDAD